MDIHRFVILNSKINADNFIRTGSSSDGDNEFDDDNGEGGKYQPQKLTRAQRKRLRKKKLKEDASRRSKIIGPLLPPTINEDANDNYRGDEIHRQDVRQNVDEKCDVTHDKPGKIPIIKSSDMVIAEEVLIHLTIVSFRWGGWVQ